jgi:3-oxoacyl-[acyl-carrier-protein] synthase II
MQLGITGVGIVSPLGLGKEINWQRLINSKSQVRYDKNFDAYIATASDFTIRKDLRQYAMAKTAVLEALSQSNMDLSRYSRDRIGFCIGESKPNLFSKFLLPENSLLEKLKKSFNFYGESESLAAACSSGILTIIKGYRLVESKLCDAVICGCCETSIHPLYIAGFKNMRVLAKRPPSPFSANRTGFAIGEGACAVVVENIENALNRNAKIPCAISGFANGIYSDNTLFINSHKKMKHIINKATNSQIPDYIHAHGSGTKLNDYNESMAIAEAFDNACEISISSTKAATGHMLGVSGIAGVAFSILAMENNIVPPTLNFTTTDINLKLDYTPNNAKKKIINSSLALSFGFGGQGAALFLKKFLRI